MNLKAIATRASKLRDIDEAYHEAARAVADDLTMQGFAALSVFKGGALRGARAPIDVVLQYPGVVVETDYDKPKYQLAVRYYPGPRAFVIEARKTSGVHYISDTTHACTFGTANERLEAACNQLAHWIGEELK